MKKIIFTFTMLFLASVYLVSEDWSQLPTNNSSDSVSNWNSNLLWESEYYSFDKNSALSNRYQYTLQFPETFLPKTGSKPILWHSGAVRKNRNTRFNRSSYSHNFSWKVGNQLAWRQRSNLNYSLVFAHNNATDKATPDKTSYKVSKTNKQIGFELSASNSDSLSIIVYDESQVAEYRQLGATEKLYYRLLSQVSYVHSGELNSTYAISSDRAIDSEGYQYHNQVTLQRNLPLINLSMDGYIDQLSIDFDYYRRYGLKSDIDLKRPNIAANFAFDKHTRKIYLLNDKIDTHVRTNYAASLALKQALAQGMSASIHQLFNVRDNRLVSSKDRNYLETDNLTGINITYEIWKLRFFNKGSHQLYSRKFKDDPGTRKQKQNVLANGVCFYHNHTDSLTISKTLTLTSTDYAASSNSLDNDLLTDEIQVSSYTLFKERIKLINHFNYVERKEVYIKSFMSGNNKTTRIYNLLPSIDIALNETFRLRQDYHLRADYDDYYKWKEWDDKPEDRMYRKFSSSFAILSSFPTAYNSSYIAPVESPFIDYTSDNHHSFDFEQEEAPQFLFHSEGLYVNIRYTYDINERGELRQSKYETQLGNEYHTLEVESIRRYSRIDLRAKPKFVWKTEKEKNYTMYEFNHLFELSYYFPKNCGKSSLSINPSGKSLRDMLWRVNFALRFNW